MIARPLLIISREGEAPRTQTLEGDVSMGRGEGNIIRLEDRAVSRNHALFRKTSEGVQIEKQSDFAPIRLNGVECTRAILKEGDVVEIGPYRVRLDAKKEEKNPEPVESRSEISREVSIEMEPMRMSAPVSSEVSVTLDDSALHRTDRMPTDFIEDPMDGGLKNGELAHPILADSDGADTQSRDPGTDIFNRPESGADDAHAELDIGFAIEEPAAVSDLALEASFPIDENGATRVETAAVKARLEVQSGRTNIQALDLTKDEIVIGRGKECDIVLKDKKSSRKNTIISRIGNRYRVKDLGSSNGTYLNDEMVSESDLSSDDVIRIGEVEIKFVALNLNRVDPQDYYVPEVTEALVETAPLTETATPALDAFRASAAPSIESIMSDENAPPAKKGIFAVYDKYFRNFGSLKPMQKLLVVLALGLFLSWYFEDELGLVEKPVKKAPQAQKKQSGDASVSLGYEALSVEKKGQIDEAVRKSTDFLRQQDFDKAIYEVQTRVFPILPEYGPAKEIERYAQEGKRRKDAIEEEARRKDSEAKLKARIMELESQTRIFMTKHKYEEAKETFGEILAIDPDNVSVSGWKQEIDTWMEEQARVEQERLVQEEINKRVWDTYNEGFELHKQGKFREAIEMYKRIPELGTSDAVLLRKSKTMIRTSQDSVRDLRDPHLIKAKELEANAQLASAFKEFKLATEVDPTHPEGWAGMERIRDILTERAKILYTEAVIAESYSDFKTAHAKFTEILAMAPEGSLYNQRAQRKLQSYLNFKSDEEIH